MEIYLYEGREGTTPLDMRGDPFRSKQTHPYNYSPFWVFRSHNQPADTSKVSGVYSDRLRGWSKDIPAFYASIEELFGKNVNDYYPTRDPEAVEQFLRRQLDKPNLRLVSILEECNVGNGFPVWYMAYENPEAGQTA